MLRLRFPRTGWLPLSWLIIGAAACSREVANVQAPPPAQTSSTPTSASHPAPPHAPRRYPPGKWRQAPFPELSRSVLWLSHLLIRHEDVEDLSVSFNAVGWYSSQPRSARSRSEALELATELAQRAHAEGNFGELAREFSEDAATAVRSGSLGGVVARHMAGWPQVLDALATLHVGDVSDVVETEFGYHLFHRRAPPPEDLVSGSHILIAHADAPWIATAARGEIPARSREDAFALARTIYEQARQDPAEFPKLVARYSEHQDAERGGDFGTWSTREPCDYPRELETLSQLEVGEVAEPIDTLFGVKLIQRTENRPRQRYAVTQIQLVYDLEKPDDDPGSKVSIYRKAQEVIRELEKRPNRFGELQERWCCTSVWEVIQGREAPRLEAAVAQLKVGEIAKEPVAYGLMQYVIPKRVELAELPELSPVLFELPGAE